MKACHSVEASFAVAAALLQMDAKQTTKTSSRPWHPRLLDSTRKTYQSKSNNQWKSNSVV